MKNVAKLAVFFSISFILLFLFSAVFRFLALWIEAVRTMPVRHDYSGNFVLALGWAVPVALYVSVLLCHSYAAREKIPVFLSIICTIVLSGVFILSSSIGVKQFRGVSFAMELAPSIRERQGLILSRNDTTMILLSENGLEGPRVLSFPDQDLLYQGESWGPVSAVLAPALPFGNETPWFIHSIFIDFSLTARQLDMRFLEGLFPFLIYAGGLILLLGSFRSLLRLSAWPLANLFLGALIFRGILSLETFLNQQETQLLISSFIGNRLPGAFITPLAFSCLGIFIILYTLLSYLAWGRRKGDD
jgi:hypothetical protein